MKINQRFKPSLESHFIESKQPIKSGFTKDVLSLKLDIINSHPSSSDSLRVEKCYRLWKQIWTETFVSLGVTPHSHSDEFLNKEICALFLGETPVALILFHFVDLSTSYIMESSYFNKYPKAVKNQLALMDGTTLIPSYLTVHPNWRSSTTNYPLAEMLTSFTVLRLKMQRAERIVTYTRNNRGMHKVFYRHGGSPLLQGAHRHNVEVDYVLIPRETAELSQHKNSHVAVTKKWNEYSVKFNNKGEINGNNRISRKRDEGRHRQPSGGPLG